MRTVLTVSVLVVLSVVLVLGLSGGPPRINSAASTPTEWQLTFTPMTHILDNNDNYSKDNRFLSYDTRETLGGGIGNGTSIYKVEIASGKETLLYGPPYKLSTDPGGPAPGLGAASFSPVTDEVVFIHGPLVSEVPTLGVYGTLNRHGGVVPGDGSGALHFLDVRDITNDPTTPGAMRGGTHRHEFTYDGTRVGFTYDDNIMTPLGYQRMCGFMMRNPKAPAGATHYAALLVPIVPVASAKTGDLTRAADDSWVGAHGLIRGFMGQVKEADGSIVQSLYAVDIPANVDITTADPGTKTRLPSPPVGTTVRRMTHTAAAGIVRGSLDGTRIGYYVTVDGTQQAFVIASDGSDTAADVSKRPVQATFLPKGAAGGLRWHPSGNSIAVLSDNGVAVTCVQPGPLFGATVFLTPHGSALASTSPEGLVWSRDGQSLAFNRRVPTYDSTGKLVKDSGANNFRQIFMVNFPDANGNGIVDAIEDGVTVNAASYETGRVAANSWATVYGTNLATAATSATTATPPTTLGGVTIDVTDSAGVKRAAMIAFVGPQSANLVIPAGTAAGYATLTVKTSDGRTLSPGVWVDPVAPALFSINANGMGAAAAVAVKYDSALNQTQMNVFNCSAGAGTCSTAPIDLGGPTDQVILLLFGTGIRGAKTVTATIGGQTATVLGFAAQSVFPGLDQVNVRIPRALIGKGEVNIVLTVDGYYSTKPVTVNIK